jgi:hypothetical protein
MSDYAQERLEFITLTIENGQTTSDVADLIGKSPVAIITPAALTGTSFTVKLSNDNSTFYDFYNTSGSQVSITVSTSRYIGFAIADFYCARYLKLVSGSSEVAEREIILVVRGS